MNTDYFHYSARWKRCKRGQLQEQMITVLRGIASSCSAVGVSARSSAWRAPRFVIIHIFSFLSFGYSSSFCYRVVSMCLCLCLCVYAWIVVLVLNGSGLQQMSRPDVVLVYVTVKAGLGILCVASWTAFRRPKSVCHLPLLRLSDLVHPHRYSAPCQVCFTLVILSLTRPDNGRLSWSETVPASTTVFYVPGASWHSRRCYAQVLWLDLAYCGLGATWHSQSFEASRHLCSSSGRAS
jgi:hypothetical protein